MTLLPVVVTSSKPINPTLTEPLASPTAAVTTAVKGSRLYGAVSVTEHWPLAFVTALVAESTPAVVENVTVVPVTGVPYSVSVAVMVDELVPSARIPLEGAALKASPYCVTQT